MDSLVFFKPPGTNWPLPASSSLPNIPNIFKMLGKNRPVPFRLESYTDHLLLSKYFLTKKGNFITIVAVMIR
jgi:hypothetical protein